MRRSILSLVCTSLVATTALVAAPGAPAASTLVVDRAPSATLSGAKTHVAGSYDHVLARGKLFVLGPDAVRVFAQGADGNQAPSRSFDLEVPAGQRSFALAVDHDGFTYVLTSDEAGTSSTIFTYAPTTTGDDGYLSSVTNGVLGLLMPIDITDREDGIAILDNDTNAIFFYDSFRTSPVQTGGIDAGSGTQTKIFGPSTVDTAPDGRLVVRGQDWVSVFAKNADGDVAPTQYVQGTKTLIGVQLGAGLDQKGNLVVATADDYDGDASSEPRILSFAPQANGNVAPRAVLAGAKAGLVTPYAEVGADGTLAVASYDADFAFGAGIDTFRALGPYGAPARPGSLTVGGVASASSRGLSWRAAATNPDTPVTAYFVKVLCGSKLVMSKRLPSTARKAGVKLGTVRSGSCTASVTAKNTQGASRPAKVRFAVRR